MQIGILQ